MDGASKIKALARAAKSFFLPAQWTHLLFLFATLLLLCAPFVPWAPSPSLSFETSEEFKRFFSGFPEYSPANPYDAWRLWYGSIALPNLLIFAAGLSCLAYSFGPSSIVKHRRWGWTFAFAFTGLAWIWVRWWTWSQAGGSALEAPLERASRLISELLFLLRGLGPGFHAAVSGVVLLAIGLALVKWSKTTLPVRLTRSAGVSCSSTLARQVFFFSLLVIGLIGLLPHLWWLGAFIIPAPERTSFRADEFIPTLWLGALVASLVPMVCIFILLRRRAVSELAPMFRLSSAKYYGIALIVPLLSFGLPPLLVFLGHKVLWEVSSLSPYPGSFPELFFIPPAWIVVVYPLALFEEVAWRGFLQPRMIQYFGLGRGIFLVALVWGLFHFPSDFGVWADYGEILSTAIFRLVSVVVFSVLLGWLVLRTGSIFPAAVMHGTINAIAEGSFAASFQGENEWAPWLGFAVWILAGYLLFTKFPVFGQRTSPGKKEEGDLLARD